MEKIITLKKVSDLKRGNVIQMREDKKATIITHPKFGPKIGSMQYVKCKMKDKNEEFYYSFIIGEEIVICY